MKKTKLIVFVIILLGIGSLLTYLNYDKIIKYFTNKEWEIADSIGKIEVERYLDAFGTNSHFFMIDGSGIKGYSDLAKEDFERAVSYKDVLSCTAGDYAIVAEKNATNVLVINKEEKVWDINISNASILGVTINKNGYSAVIYSQAGYKSLIKVFSNTGKELFTNYLASTYAVDAAISNDNKTLAIAEIDTNGVSATSGIKLVNIQSAVETQVKKIELENEEIISDIAYDEGNHLILLTDAGIKFLKGDKFVELINFKEENVILASISNEKRLVAVRVVEETLFSVKCEVCSYSYQDAHDIKTYEIEETPNKIVTCNDIIAVDTGNKIIFLNLSGNFVKKCEYNGQLKDIQLFNHGKVAVLLFRDTAEFIKVGGI